MSDALRNNWLCKIDKYVELGCTLGVCRVAKISYIEHL